MQNSIKFYTVGGYVRDTIIGVPSKDIDYAVEAPSYEAMRDYIALRGKIYQERPQFLTIRAKLNNEDCDYVLCRKEGHYTDGRRPDSVSIGTIYDDLARRDFTCNAIAINENGDYIDPHGGIEDIQDQKLRCVGNARERFSEDSLRLLRAIRFEVTKNLELDDSIVKCLNDKTIVNLLDNVSIERIREELYKCFVYDTPATLTLLEEFDYLKNKIFTSRIILVPTIHDGSK